MTWRYRTGMQTGECPVCDKNTFRARVGQEQQGARTVRGTCYQCKYQGAFVIRRGDTEVLRWEKLPSGDRVTTYNGITYHARYYFAYGWVLEDDDDGVQATYLGTYFSRNVREYFEDVLTKGDDNE